MEHHANLLWIPADSSYNVNEVSGKYALNNNDYSSNFAQDWLEQYFKKSERDQIVLFKSQNVLTPKAINEVISLKTFIILFIFLLDV